MTSISLRRLAAGAATAALAVGSLALAAAPAAHAGTVTGLANGTAGLQQTITVNGFQGCGDVSLITSGISATSTDAYVDINGNATIYWTPLAAGTATVTLNNVCGPYTVGTVSIGQTGTSTSFSAPNVAKVGQSTKVTVLVTSNSPSTYVPTGTVTVRDGNGNQVGNPMGLTAGPGNGQSYAYWWWTPPTAGSYTFQATYNGDTSATTSQSYQDTINASASGSTISLAAPATANAGSTVTLTASVVPSTLQGSVGFTYNGQPISASIPIVNGSASMNWVVTGAGANVLGASYTTNGGASGSTTSKITVAAGPVQSDVITLTQPGWGVWAPNGTYRLGNGTSFTFQASTLSGAPVTLTETGPCQVSGLTLSVNQPNATCNLVAKSAGANGYGPVSQGYTVTTSIGQQTATLAAPPSGRVNVGKSIVLEAPGQADTNAGQNIVWNVKKGSKKVCKLGFPSDGSVTVKLTKRGQCTVIGKAPGVPNTWAPFKVMRTYTA